MRKPRGINVSGDTYATVLEEYERKMNNRNADLNKKPAGVADALDRAYWGYSKRPGVKPYKVKGK